MKTRRNRSLLMILLAVICCLVCALGLAGCSTNPSDNGDNQGAVQTPPAGQPDDEESDKPQTPAEKPDDKEDDKPHTHALTKVPAKPADCETAGNKVYYTCACGKWFTDANGKTEITDKTTVIIKATGHTTTRVPAKPADCETAGNIEYYTCTCGKWFADANAKTEITDKSTVTLEAYTPNKYTVTFELGEGDSLDCLTTTVTYNEKIKLPVPSNKSYSFLGWYYGTTQITNNDGSMLSIWEYEEDIILTAKSESIFVVKNGAITGLTTAGKKFTEIEVISDIGGNKINSIGDYAFSGCSGLTSITIPDGVTSIGEGAFSGCNGLTSITIGNGVMSIGSSAFSDCSKLTSVTIPDSVTSIDSSAFRDCSGLTSVTIGSGVTSIDSSAFRDCGELANITVKNGNTKYYSAGNCLIETASQTLIIGCKNSVIPSDDNVTRIGSSAFESCSGLTSVTIPDSVTSIGDWAFYDCSGLTSVTIGSGVTSIDSSAFRDCGELANITVKNGNTKYYSAGNCLIETASQTLIIGCKNSVIPSDGSVTSIGDSAFETCSGLTSVTIPDSVTSIGDWAFYDCSGLTSVTIPDSVTSIGDYAFSGCSGLTSITIPDGVTSISDYAFYGCSGLTSITIPDGVTSIGYSAFYDCSRLTSVTIPDSVTSIGLNAFYGCRGLISIKFNGTIEQWKAITKYNGWNSFTGSYIVYCSDGNL